MKKVLLTLLLGGALAIGVVAASSAATVRCIHKLYCPGVHPVIVHKTPKGCRALGKSFTLPDVKVSDRSGIKVITIKLGSKVIYTKTFSGRGPLTYTVHGLKVSTAGLHAGGHGITIYAKDFFGVSRTSSERFTVCAPKPVFTG